MTLAIRARRAAFLSAFVVMAALVPASAQEIAASHLKAARAAITSLQATDEFDQVLPQAAAELKQTLIQRNPDMVQIISATVDEKALELAVRRGDLEREAATIYAKIFTEQELNEIAAFYNSDTGKKLLSDGEIVGRETMQAAAIWQRGLARDLAQAVGTHLDSVVGAQAQPAVPGVGPVEPEAQVNQ